MIRNYIKTALRSLAAEKTNTIINIAGLTLGITASLVIFLIVENAMSYDDYHTNRDRIYRLITKSRGNTGDTYGQGIPSPLPEAFKNDFKEAEEVIFTSYRWQSLISVVQTNGELKKFEEGKGVVFTQPGFFALFDRKVLKGSSAALVNPNNALISKKWALKYFGTEEAMGRVIRYEDADYQIAGILEDYPSNTDLPFELMLSYATIKKSWDERGWGSISDTDNCYFLLKEGEQVSSVEAQMPAFIKKYFGEDDVATRKTFLVQPLSELHSDSHVGNYNMKMPKEAFIVFTIIGIFLLATACINFINLTTAEAIKRTKQVGIRKVLGSSRGQLVAQFLSESFIITIAAVLLSLLAAQVLLGFINPLMELSLTLPLASNGVVWIFLIVIVLGVTIASGLYPALAISGFKPALALKNQTGSKRSSGKVMRSGLVVAQFFISQFFIIGTIVITRQMDYIQHQDLGFEKQAIVTVPIPDDLAVNEQINSDKKHSFKNEILQLPGVEKASLCYAPPSFRAVLGSNFSIAGKEEEYNTQLKQVDGDYLSLYNINLVAGEKMPDADTLYAVVVNEKLAKMAGLTNEEIIGKELLLWDKHLPIRGVVKDFNTTSLNRPIEPVVLMNDISGYRSLSIKLHPVSMQETLKQVQAKWEAAYPEFIFRYDFIDDQVRNLYRGERKLTTLLNIFSTIAIIIGCLGLYGLVAFMANQKTKEIGVRKVLGASVESIVFLFSKEFAKLIFLGFILAAPIAGFLMNKILQEFAYRIEMGPMIFLTGLGITFLIAFLTVGFRSIKAAMTNPVKSLRSE